MRVLILLVCGALIGCAAEYGAERAAKGAKAFCDRAGFEAGTPEHGECMLRYVEALSSGTPPKRTTCITTGNVTTCR